MKQIYFWFEQKTVSQRVLMYRFSSRTQIIDMASMQQRMKELNCVDVTPPDSPVTDDHIKAKRFLAKPESLDSLAYSDSELSWRNEYTDANSNNTKVIMTIDYFCNIYNIIISRRIFDHVLSRQFLSSV